jgi:signal transduction histidine kinase
MPQFADPASTPPDPVELQQRRREIHRGLQRSFYAVLSVSALVGLLVLAAVWLSRQSQERASEAQTARQRAEVSAVEARRALSRLWDIGSSAAAVQRKTRHEGQRTASLRIIAEAASFRPSRQLRDEALSALLLPDVGGKIAWHPEDGNDVAGTYDASFEHFILNDDHGHAIVRFSTNGSVQMDEPGLGQGGVQFWQFSPDGRLAAITFKGGEIGVWDWRRKALVARFPSVEPPEWAEPSFDFTPDGQRLWVIASSHLLREYSIETGLPGNSVELENAARSVRLSPSGKLAAVACGKDLEVWDLSSRERRATLALTNVIWRLAWQPGEERLAIGCYGSLWLWEVGAPAAVSLREDFDAMTVVFFNADGDLLFVSGWNHAPQVWDIRNRRVLLELDSFDALQLSPDQTRLAVGRGRVGYGIHQYLPPVGLRNWPSPPSLGQQAGGDFDPRERWVLTAHLHGWLIRDADSGRELARADCERGGMASFSSDGSNVVAWVKEGLARWPLAVHADGSLAVLPKRVFALAAPRESRASCFSADRHFTAYSLEGVVNVVNTDDPSLWVAIPLRHTNDNSLYLSPDGHWLITGHNNQHGLDWYDTRAEKADKFIRTFAEQGFAGPVFDPHTGALFTCTGTNYTKWNLATGEPERSVPWRVPASFQCFMGFAADGRRAITKCNPSSFHLHDLQTGRDFATLDFRDFQATIKCIWTRDGKRLFLFDYDGSVTRIDLAPLRSELEKLGLNWSDDEPSRMFDGEATNTVAEQVSPGKAATGSRADSTGLAQPARLVVFVSVTLLLTILIGLYILRYQRRLFGGYLETEALAAQREVQLRDAQAALLQGEKMKALGTLAAGVAHDFNNLLSVVRLSSELIEEQTHPNGLTQENFQAISQAVQRGQGIVNSMLGYVRVESEPVQFNVEDLISEAVSLLAKPFLGGLVLRVQVEAGTRPVFARKGRVEQMLFNLVVNAADALQGKGTLTLGASEVSAPGTCVLAPKTANRYVRLYVADSGPGIPPEIRARIFEPFFTTKTKGAARGTGLGLSMLYTMAKEDGIGVSVETESGKGTIFALLLPLAERMAGKPAAILSGATCPSPTQNQPPITGIENA